MPAQPEAQLMSVTCERCGVAKSPMAFYLTDLGRIRFPCKECRQAAQRQRRIDNLPALLERERAYREKNAEKRRAYDKTRQTPARVARFVELSKANLAAHPERKHAATAVSNALRDGRMSRQPCLICGETAEAHHPDYSRPLDVVWLCTIHHRQAHGIARRRQTDARV